MTFRIPPALAMGSLLYMAPSAGFDPHIDKIEQNTRTVEWLQVSRVTVAQKSSRMIRLTGPWMDMVTSATTSNGVSARNIVREWPYQKVTMVLDASASALRGDMSLRLNISCPVIPLDCKPTINLPVKVFETGPIATIFPNGTVPPNAQVTFDLTGEAMGVATLLPRLLSLKNASILSKTTTTMRVRGTTPSCGYVDVALTDQADGDENPYLKATTVKSVLAGTICGSSLVPRSPTVTVCPTGQTWDPVAHVCKP